MGRYGLTVVNSTIKRVDEYPCSILLETKEFVDFRNGRVMAFPEGIMVVVGHYNTEGWGPDCFNRYILVVSTTNWFPEQNPEDGDDTIIGYYTEPCMNGEPIKTFVKRAKYMKCDAAIESALRSEGRWPYKS